jgi:hypothetical protein
LKITLQKSQGLKPLRKIYLLIYLIQEIQFQIIIITTTTTITIITTIIIIGN